MSRSHMFTDAILLRIKAAKNLRNVDMFGQSDPYAKLSFTGSGQGLFCTEEETGKYKTKTIENNLDPEWNETVSIVLDPIVEAIKVEVKSDKTGMNPSLGETLLPISRETPFRPSEAWYVISEKHESLILIEQTYIPMTLASSFASRLDSFQKRMEEAEADDVSDEERIAQLSAQVENLTMEKESQQETITQLQGELNAQNDQIKEMQDDIEEMQKNTEELSEDIDELGQEKEALEEQIKTLEEENDKLEEESDKFEEEIANLKEENAQLKEDQDEAERDAEREKRLQEQAKKEAERALKKAERAQKELERKKKDPLDLKEKSKKIAEQGKKFGKMFRRR